MSAQRTEAHDKGDGRRNDNFEKEIRPLGISQQSDEKPDEGGDYRHSQYQPCKNRRSAIKPDDKTRSNAEEHKCENSNKCGLGSEGTFQPP